MVTRRDFVQPGRSIPAKDGDRMDRKLRINELERRAELITGKSCLVFTSNLLKQGRWGLARKRGGLYEIGLDATLFTRAIENKFSISEIFFHELAHIIAGDLEVSAAHRHPESERRADVLGAILELQHGKIDIGDALSLGVF